MARELSSGAVAGLSLSSGTRRKPTRFLANDRLSAAILRGCSRRMMDGLSEQVDRAPAFAMAAGWRGIDARCRILAINFDDYIIDIIIDHLEIEIEDR
jgi:hypothetical protein